jgi:hypothetical protein
VHLLVLFYELISENINVFNLQVHFVFRRLSRWRQIANSCKHRLYVAVSGEVVVVLSVRTFVCGFDYSSFLALKYCYFTTTL